MTVKLVEGLNIQHLKIIDGIGKMIGTIVVYNYVDGIVKVDITVGKTRLEPIIKKQWRNSTLKAIQDFLKVHKNV